MLYKVFRMLRNGCLSVFLGILSVAAHADELDRERLIASLESNEQAFSKITAAKLVYSQGVEQRSEKLEPWTDDWRVEVLEKPGVSRFVDVTLRTRDIVPGVGSRVWPARLRAVETKEVAASFEGLNGSIAMAIESPFSAGAKRRRRDVYLIAPLLQYTAPFNAYVLNGLPAKQWLNAMLAQASCEVKRRPDSSANLSFVIRTMNSNGTPSLEKRISFDPGKDFAISQAQTVQDGTVHFDVTNELADFGGVWLAKSGTTTTKESHWSLKSRFLLASAEVNGAIPDAAFSLTRLELPKGMRLDFTSENGLHEVRWWSGSDIVDPAASKELGLDQSYTLWMRDVHAKRPIASPSLPSPNAVVSKADSVKSSSDAVSPPLIDIGAGSDPAPSSRTMMSVSIVAVTIAGVFIIWRFAKRKDLDA